MADDDIIPEWLYLLEPANIKIVKHSQIIPLAHLPTYNSQAIEANLHNIDGLSDIFIYSNDDIFINKPLKEEDFI